MRREGRRGKPGILNLGSSSIKLALPDGRRESFAHPREAERVRKALHWVKEYDLREVILRVVHGEYWKGVCRATKARIESVKRASSLAPLHNPPVLRLSAHLQEQGIRVWYAFDTTPYTHQPRLPLPKRITTRIPPGGFHGWSHLHAARHASHNGWREFITVHTGGGTSVTAWKKGRTVWTSMSITPLAGVMGATRSGSIDPGLVLWLVKQDGVERVEEMLWHASGWKALSGEEDFRKVFTQREEEPFATAFEAYLTSLAEQISMALTHLSTPEALVFTGPISSNRIVRTRVLKRLHMPLKAVWVETDEESEIWRAWENEQCWHAKRETAPHFF